MAWEWQRTCRSSPDLAHKMDNPRHESPLPLNTRMTVFVSNLLLYKRIVPLNIFYSVTWMKSYVFVLYCAAERIVSWQGWTFLGPLQTSCIFARLCSDLSNTDFKEWQPLIPKTCSFTFPLLRPQVMVPSQNILPKSAKLSAWLPV